MKRNIHVGLKLFVAALIVFAAVMASKAMAFTLMLIAGIWLMAPISFKARRFAGKLYEGDPDGDEDEAKQVLEKVRKQTEKILQQRGFVNKDALNQELETRMAKLKDFSDEDMKLLKLWLEEGDKGIRSILRKQGEEITALRELQNTGKKKEFIGVRAMLQDKKVEDKLRKIFETGEGEIRLDVRAAVNMTTDNTITGHAALPDDMLESFSIGAFVPKRQAREYVFDLAYRRTVAKITQFKTWLEEGNEEGGFAVVAEGGLKPLVSTSLVRNHSEYKKVAAKQVVTEEFAKFRAEAYTIIERLINQKLIRDYAAILTTDLVAAAAPYTASALDGLYANPTDYHAIAAVAAQIEALNFMPDTLILNPQDKWRIGMLQDANGQFFLTIPVTDPSGQTKMMGFNVRTSNKIAVGDFILGEAGLWEIEDEPITIRMGMGIDVTPGTVGVSVTQVSSDFDNNRFRIIAETFFHNYIASNNEGSFVKTSFATVKAAIDTAP